jgi:hypothetical protein
MEQSLWSWLTDNKDWVFSGIGVAVMGLLCRWLFARKKSAQTQMSGNNSTNIQAGGDIHIGAKDAK